MIRKSVQRNEEQRKDRATHGRARTSKAEESHGGARRSKGIAKLINAEQSEGTAEPRLAGERNTKSTLQRRETTQKERENEK